jgi:hypothetical protein
MPTFTYRYDLRLRGQLADPLRDLLIPTAGLMGMHTSGGPAVTRMLLRQFTGSLAFLQISTGNQ